jgi:hypothetical protein
MYKIFHKFEELKNIQKTKTIIKIQNQEHAKKSEKTKPKNLKNQKKNNRKKQEVSCY